MKQKDKRIQKAIMIHSSVLSSSKINKQHEGDVAMELGTFGSVFTFAIQLEKISSKFYEEAVSVLESPEAKKLFTLLGTGVSKRKKKVEKTRQEFIRESILVHVTGLKRSDYEVKVSSLQRIGDQQLLEMALELEENSYRFYKEASTKIGLPDVGRVFKRLAKENSDRQLQLESLHKTADPT